jgi:mRNA interferase RelE/StbE
MKRPEFRLRVPAEVADLIRGMHPHLKKKVGASLKLIMADPGEGKSLRDELSGLRSFRIGRFRIIYAVKRISSRSWPSAPARGFMRRPICC